MRLEVPAPCQAQRTRGRLRPRGLPIGWRPTTTANTPVGVSTVRGKLGSSLLHPCCALIARPIVSACRSAPASLNPVATGLRFGAVDEKS